MASKQEDRWEDLAFDLITAVQEVALTCGELVEEVRRLRDEVAALRAVTAEAAGAWVPIDEEGN
jgi:hypothetical protein